MLSFKELSEKKKTNVLINPKKKDITEKNHGEDCDCMKCEQKRRADDVNDGPDIANEELKMTRKAYSKIHKDFRSDMKNPRTTKYVPGKGTVSMPVKFVEEGHKSCGEGQYYCYDDKKCKPIPEGYKEGKDGMLVKEAKYEAGASNYGKMSIRNKRAVGYGGNAAPPEERAKAHAERMKKHKGMKEDVSAKDRFKRDAGAIAKKKMRNKEHRKYVNFLDVDENTIHSFNTFIQNNKPYDSQKEVSEESDKESKVETSLLKFSECWKTHKKVGMKMKGGKLVNDCRPKNEEVEVVNEVSDKLKKSYIKGATKDIEKLRKTGKTPSGELDTPSADKVLKRKINIGKTMATMKKEEVELDEKVYTGPDKKDRAVIKKMDNPSYAKKLADYEKNMDPKKRQALKDKATKGMKFTHEGRDLALDAIRAKYKDQIMKRGQPKKVKGAKSTVGTGKYKKMADQKKQTASDAKKRGFKSTQDYVNTMARYGGKDNYDKGKGLGT